MEFKDMQNMLGQCGRTLSMGLAQLMLTTMLFYAPAQAQDSAQLGAFKAQGLVGERPDGLLGAVQSTPDVAALVEQINAQRLAAYQQIAQETGAPLPAVQAQAGQKLTGSAPGGSFVMDASGKWVRK